jgi:hypothetical protein
MDETRAQLVSDLVAKLDEAEVLARELIVYLWEKRLQARPEHQARKAHDHILAARTRATLGRDVE